LTRPFREVDIPILTTFRSLASHKLARTPKSPLKDGRNVAIAPRVQHVPPSRAEQEPGMVEQRIRLRIVEPAALRETCEFGRAALIGRAETADLRLRDSSISRHHAEIDPTGLGWTIRDSGSRNGTYLNGTQVGRVARALHDNDLLQCGNVVMRVEAVTVASPEPDDSSGPLKVSACTRQSLEQAADVLAISMTRSTRPAEQLLSLLRVGQGPDRDGSLDEFLLRSVQDRGPRCPARVDRPDRPLPQGPERPGDLPQPARRHFRRPAQPHARAAVPPRRELPALHRRVR
jgi:pSer/pThr/pTyr-binding forkhead associated (FHA) protein